MATLQDLVLGDLVVRRSLLDEALLQQCLADQRRSPGVPLARLLVERRLVAPRDLSLLLQAVDAARLACGRCQLDFPIHGLDPTRSPACQRCQGPLIPRYDRVVLDLPGSPGESSRPTRTGESHGPTLQRTWFDSADGSSPRQSARPPSDTVRDLPSQSSRTGPIASRQLRVPGGALGERFGEYELVEELGRGAMGVVYKARKPGLDRFVALKVLLKGTRASRKQVKRFQREAEMSARLKHPNIVTVHDVGRVGGFHYFTMDCVEGTPASRLIKDRRLSFRRAAEITRDVALGLQHAHEREVIHRDVKPANIIVERDGLALVTDFGLARELNPDEDDRLTREGALVGTPYYMSPEQASGKRSLVGPLSDVYALGVVLYEMLTHQVPFTAETQLELASRIINQPPRRPVELRPKLPPALEAIVLRAMAKAPKHRYASAGELAEDLDRWLSGRATAARPSTPISRLLETLHARRLPLAVGGALVLSVVLGGVGYVRHRAGLRRQEAEELAAREAEALQRAAAEAARERERGKDLARAAERSFLAAGRTPTGEAYQAALREALASLTEALAHPANAESPQLRVVRARAYERTGQLDLAQRDLEQATALDSRGSAGAEAALLLVRLLQRRDAEEEATARLDEALTRYAESGAWGDLLQALRALRREERLDEALAVVGRAQEQDPGLGEAHALEGVLLLALSRPRDAVRAFERAVEIDPKAAMTWANLAQVRLVLDPPRGREDLARALELDPQLERALLLRAELASAEGRREDAIDDLRTVLAKSPENADVLHRLAELYLEEAQQTLALQVLERLARSAPLDPRPYELRARIALSQRDFRGACLELLRGCRELRDAPEARTAVEELEERFRRLVLDARQRELASNYLAERRAEAPQDLGLRLFEVRLLLAESREAEAIALLERLRNEDPDYIPYRQLEIQIRAALDWTDSRLQRELIDFELAVGESHEGLVFCAKGQLMLLRDFDKAAALGRRLRELSPRSPEGPLLLGLVAMERQQVSTAQACIAQALALDPDNTEVLAVLGVLEYNRQDLAACERAVRRCLAIDPFNSNAREGLLVALLSGKRLEECEEAGQDYLHLCEQVGRPPSPNLLTVLLKCYEKQGRTNTGLELLSDLGARHPEHPEYRLLLANTHAQAGRRDEARRLVDQVLAEHPDHRLARELATQLDEN